MVPSAPDPPPELVRLQAELDRKDAEVEALRSAPVERSGIWHTSPVLVAVATAALGLIGTGIATALQGANENKLERHRFESELVQSALVSEVAAERARHLEFLVDVGLVESLDHDAIARVASSPIALPRTEPSPLALPDSLRARLRQFQDGQDLPASGQVDAATLERLLEAASAE